MPYVKISKDLTKIKNKPILNMTARQIVCFSIAGIVGIPMYLLTKGVIGNSAAVLLMIGLMLPFFFFAMFEKDGQPAEKIFRNFVRTRMGPGIRPYKTENIYAVLSKSLILPTAPMRGLPVKTSQRRSLSGLQATARYLAEEGEHIATKKETAGTAPAKKYTAGQKK